MKGDIIRKWRCAEHNHPIKDLGRDGWGTRFYGCDCRQIRVKADDYRGPKPKQRFP